MARAKILNEREEIIFKWFVAEGYPDGQIAKVFQLGRSTVEYIRKSLGLDAVCSPGRYRGKKIDMAYENNIIKGE